MALFSRRRLATRDEAYDTGGYWSLPGGYGVSAAGYSSSTDNAIRNAASFACINVLVDALGRTPLDAVRYVAGARHPVDPPPKLLQRPSGVVRKDVWRTQLAWGLVTDGNAFGAVMAASNRGYPTQIEWLDSSQISERKVVGGVAQVRVGQGGDIHRIWPDGDIFHIPGRMVTGGSPFGVSPLQAANKAIRTALAAEDFSLRYFTEDAHPSKVFLIDGQPDNESLERARANYERVMRPGSREPLFIPKSTDMRELQADLNTTEYLDLMRFEVEQACRFWGVPPSMVYAAVKGADINYANATQNDTSTLKNTLDGYYVREEEALTDCLPAPQVVKANRDVILRADVMTRWQVHTMALAAKARTVNEVRAIEDEEPFDDPIYDEPGVPGSPSPIPPQGGDTMSTPTGPGGNGDMPLAAPADGTNARRAPVRVTPRVVETISPTQVPIHA